MTLFHIHRLFRGLFEDGAVIGRVVSRLSAFVRVLLPSGSASQSREIAWNNSHGSQPTDKNDIYDL